MGKEAGDMKIKALAPWFGAKRNLAPRIVELLGKHSVYWEPFCGSMAVLLVKPRCHAETVNDLHEDLFNLATVLADRALRLELYRRVRSVLVCEQFIDQARTILQEPLEKGVDRAFWYFINSWIGRNGSAGTKVYNQHFARRFTARGGNPARRFVSTVESIPAWGRRLKTVTILNMDAFELLDRVEDARGTAIYVDPPYLKKTSYYIHDFAPEDHNRLAELLNRFKKARVVVSYYKDPRLDELYPDWWREEIEVAKALAHQGARGKNKTKAIEVLLVNQVPEIRKGQAGLFE